MMRRAAIHEFQVHVGGGRLGEGAEKIFEQFGLEVADACGAENFQLQTQ